MRLDDSRTRASGGHGLGLSIVRRIIYWHAGRAQIGRSETLGGARFSLVWPRRQSEAETL
ncbi:Sensor protein RstB [compost metagenome]